MLNKPIVHLEASKPYQKGRRKVYFCNQQALANNEKLTSDIKKVTCKKCLNYIQNFGLK